MRSPIVERIDKAVSRFKSALFRGRRFFVCLLILGLILPFNNCAKLKEDQMAMDLSSLSTDPGSQSLSGTNSLSLTTLNGHTMYACDPTLLPKTPMIKMSNREFTNALFSLMNDFSPSASALLSTDTQLNTLLGSLDSDNMTTGRFNMQEQNFLITQKSASDYFGLAYRAGELVAGSAAGLANYPNTGSCLAASTLTQTCHQLWVKELGSRAFRRKLSNAEAIALSNQLWDASLSKVDLIQLTFTTITQMPDFFYRIYDHGGASPRGATVLNLTAEDLASKVSFLLTGKAPDATLKSLAASGQLLDNTVLSQQIDRLLATADAQTTIRRLFRESYGYDIYDNFIYSANFLNGINSSGLYNPMTAELDGFFIDEVLNKKGSFESIMTSQSATINDANLAKVYGYSSAPGNVILPNNRKGFINRAAFLSKRSGNYTTPIKRGLDVLENILCEQIGDPPPNAPTSVSEEQIVGQYHSTRDRYASISEIPGSSCITCHSRINSLGYTFEGFDSIGRARTMESIYTSATGTPVAAVTVNTATVVPDLHPNQTSISSSTELAEDLGQNEKAMACFVRKLKNFETRSPATANDACQLNQSLKTMYGSGGVQGSIQDAIKSLILSDDFKVWSY